MPQAHEVEIMMLRADMNENEKSIRQTVVLDDQIQSKASNLALTRKVCKDNASITDDSEIKNTAENV